MCAIICLIIHIKEVLGVLVKKTFKYRIYPNDEQQLLIQKTLGCCRFVFNHFLEKWNTAYAETGKGLSYNQCAKQLPVLKTSLEWLEEVDSTALQTAVRHLADSFDRFFKKTSRAPRFKSRRNPVQSYTAKQTNGNIAIRGHEVKLPKLGWMRFANSRACEGRIISATMRRHASGKYFVSILCEVEQEPLPAAHKHIGIDLGLKAFAVCSDGLRVESPKAFCRYEKKLAFWQRRMSRRTKGGSNWHKAKVNVARIYEKIANIRQNFLQQLTTKLIRENQTISIEGLDVVNMLKNTKLAKSIADASWGEFERQLTYKAKWYGRTLKFAEPFAPTSQTCHVCGFVNPKVKHLSIREWNCPSCKTSHDRDNNAAQNIKRVAI
ncbi:IS200/IS605 family element RNA-guided endonuclease TnpB [Paenibacillus urinalis]|uniref:IS200/IS605 family element RNA-guided endonuclease TnpB n=1 Tax=Paenibacillus urinalis TaxID=521520 RepID=UPI00236841F3|nr:IS200/IS605 family element RNA-guided endonuclease TnpB [Paenibacillus urinalis]WDH99703.1 IS200/IS605 family element RNA-guided endonuclease TnpB [Paenibacillus urinalis]